MNQKLKGCEISAMKKINATQQSLNCLCQCSDFVDVDNGELRRFFPPNFSGSSVHYKSIIL